MGIDLLGGVLIYVIDHLVKHLRVDMEMKMEWNGNGIKWVTKLALRQQVVLAALDQRLHGSLRGSLTTLLLCELLLLV